MSAQEREALVDLLAARLDVVDHFDATGSSERAVLAVQMADALLAAGWTRRSVAEIKAEALREAVLDPRVWPGQMSRILLDLADEVLAPPVREPYCGTCGDSGRVVGPTPGANGPVDDEFDCPDCPAGRDQPGRSEAEAWERGAYAGREYQKRLQEWSRPLGQGPMPVHPPNPYHADFTPLTNEGGNP